MRARILLAVLVISGFLPLLTLFDARPNPTPLVYSLFIALYLIRKVRVSVHKDSLSPAVRFVMATVGVGLLTEVLAWIGNYNACNPVPALFHPQLVPDLILATGFYGAWGIAWALVAARYRFTVGQMFWTQGLFGVVIEQQGAVLLSGLAAMPAGLLLWLYVAAVHGSIIGGAFQLVGGRVGGQQREGRWKYPIAWIVIFLAIVTVSLVWGQLMGGLIPEKRAICEYPLF